MIGAAARLPYTQETTITADAQWPRNSLLHAALKRSCHNNHLPVLAAHYVKRFLRDALWLILPILVILGATAMALLYWTPLHTLF